MYRVELKVLTALLISASFSRVPNVPCGVESATTWYAKETTKAVPNVPCGVESAFLSLKEMSLKKVPNVPCGVESLGVGLRYHKRAVLFLMYRVELKEEVPISARRAAMPVPNVPCGVESQLQLWLSHSEPSTEFLMYRVELKVLPSITYSLRMIHGS